MRVLSLALAASLASAADSPSLERDLDSVARVASAMVDGDLCARIVTPRALTFMHKKDPRDRYVDSDNYDVDDAAFTAVKKTLIRLSTLSAYPVDVNLWMPVPGSPESIQIVIRNRYELSQFWEWGKISQQMFPEMHGVLDTGRRVAVKKRGNLVSVLAPVHNSLNEIVGLVEVVAARRND